MATKALTDSVAALLRKRFPGCVVDLEPGAEHDKVGGWVIWGGFDDLDQVDRQRKLRATLNELPQDERLQLGPILTLTPYEASDDEEAA